jgi:hypothetical protein
MTSSSRGRFGVGERTEGERGDDSAAMLFAARGSAAGVTGVSFGVDFREKKFATDGRGLLLLLAFLPLLEEEDEDVFFDAAGLAEVEAAAAEGFATGFLAGDATKDDTDSMGLLGVAAPLDSF